MVAVAEDLLSNAVGSLSKKVADWGPMVDRLG